MRGKKEFIARTHKSYTSLARLHSKNAEPISSFRLKGREAAGERTASHPLESNHMKKTQSIYIPFRKPR